MSDLLAEALSDRPNDLAADDGTQRWTFADLASAADRATSALVDAGAGPGRTVVLEVDPSLAALAVLHGAMRTGALVAPLNARLAAPERAAALAALGPAVVVTEATLASLFRNTLGPTPAPVARDPHAPLAVLWTSGTSGSPRGVLLTEAGLRASAEGSRARLGLHADDVWYASLSPAHVGGLALLTRAAILGAGLVVRGRFSIAELESLIDAGAVTHASLVPTMLLRLLEAREGRPPPATLRLLLVGGAHAPRPLIDRALADGYPVALTYGLTEATSQVATAPPDLVRQHPDSVGLPLPGVEVRISGEGEIEVRGETVSPGLLSGEPLTDAEGWIATGDRGELDARGHLSVTGRTSRRIVSGGVTLDPYEIEAVLRLHPDVVDACVVGLPDDTWGERVVALIVPEGSIDLAALHPWLAARLSTAKRPRTLRTVAALPLNPNGKIDVAAVRALVAAPDPGADDGVSV